MSYSKQEWVNNISVANQERMNHIENGIYQNSLDIETAQDDIETAQTDIETAQTDIQDLQNQLNDIGQYSTSEIAVGTWIDGKTIYRKVFTSTNTTNISTGITPDNIIKMECLTHQTVGAWRTIPWLYSLNDTIGNGSWAGGFYFNDSDSTIRFQLGSNLAALNKVIVIMEYTK